MTEHTWGDEKAPIRVENIMELKMKKAIIVDAEGDIS